MRKEEIAVVRDTCLSDGVGYNIVLIGEAFGLELACGSMGETSLRELYETYFYSEKGEGEGEGEGNNYNLIRSFEGEKSLLGKIEGFGKACDGIKDQAIKYAEHLKEIFFKYFKSEVPVNYYPDLRMDPNTKLDLQ